MSDDDRRTTLMHLLAETRRRSACPYYRYFPDTGPLRRELYPRSLLFFAAGLQHRERVFLAANRVGKTVTAAYEVTAHATGDYPVWWPGRRFEGPTDWWVAGDTRETTRDVIQLELFGSREGIRQTTRFSVARTVVRAFSADQKSHQTTATRRSAHLPRILSRLPSSHGDLRGQ